MIKDAGFTIGLYSGRGLFSSSVTAAASLSTHFNSLNARLCAWENCV